jgi:hypothetical protein
MDHAQTLTQEEKHLVLGVVCFLIYASSLLMMGTAWWKAPAIAVLFATTYLAGWCDRWISRGAVMSLVVGSLVWLDTLPPLALWKPIATTVIAMVIPG